VFASAKSPWSGVGTLSHSCSCTELCDPGCYLGCDVCRCARVALGSSLLPKAFSCANQRASFLRRSTALMLLSGHRGALAS